ncbi:Heterokaryon incompatibility protein HET [Aspergillus parasiticus SU-1]|uniref:Heterokaryon incompatibility protein HET n=1 Tax=Aspergillus parasiticus (strain ATCC 56775 / NRRL 5862 / SRRC 143 / SU-1) TaxID=1403190 RepID=A0A0F0IB49_ASPPU|nr:Heterokaryon incompatibility protein HET [Aspergillus parasiticus SU-1]
MGKAMDEEIPSYVYLHIEPDECRVLKIVEVHPLIKFSLEAFSIYEAPGYEALSYAWGTSSGMEDSLRNGARFRISRTLGQALSGIHAHSGGGWIWVDAICINQTDAEEKVHQVAGMGELYSCADQVLVWLGDAANHSDLACTLLSELTEKIWSLKDTEGGWGPLSTDDAVAHRAWFQRLWIVQEVVLARACVVLCGLQQIEWHILVKFAIATSKSFFVSKIAGLHVKAMGEDRVSRSTNGIRLIRNSRRLKDSLEDDEKEITGLQATMDIMQSQGASVKVD